MDDFTRKLITEWRRLGLPFEGESILIAVSGGADSTALALALKELIAREKMKNHFFVGHFDHQIRGKDSTADSEFVENFSSDLGFEVVSGTITNGKLAKAGNLEQSARDARYRFLVETALENGCSTVLTAHTKNDQAETLLLNLVRGSGIEGLSGMAPLRDLYKNEITLGESRESQQKVIIARPLLTWAYREDTEGFVRSHRIDFRKDAMNDDMKFARVRVRKNLIAVLKEFNPNIVDTLSRTAILLREEGVLLREFDELLFNRALAENPNLSIKTFHSLSKHEGTRLIRYWLLRRRGNLRRINQTHITAIMSLVNSRKSGRKTELPDGKCVVKRDGMLIYEQNQVEK